jgi:hypothetical protein
MNDLDRGFRNFHITDYGLFSPIHVDILCILVTLMFPWKGYSRQRRFSLPFCYQRCGARLPGPDRIEPIPIEI